MAPSESAEASQGTSPISEDTHFSVDTPAHREDGAFKARKTKADIERLQAKIGQDILTLAHGDYGHQPVGKPKQKGFNFGSPKQNDLFDADNVSGYVSEKENWKSVRENNPTAAPLQQLSLAFDQPADTGRPAGVLLSQRVRMQTTGRLRVTAGKVRTAADAARLLSQFSNSAQENLFTIAVDMDPPIPNQ